jgi:hypothetical protein
MPNRKIGHLRFFVILILAASAAAPVALSQSAARPWMNTNLSAEERVDPVLKQMTLEEKLSLLHGNGMAHIPQWTMPFTEFTNGGAGYVEGVKQRSSFLSALYHPNSVRIRARGLLVDTTPEPSRKADMDFPGDSIRNDRGVADSEVFRRAYSRTADPPLWHQAGDVITTGPSGREKNDEVEIHETHRLCEEVAGADVRDCSTPLCLCTGAGHCCLAWSSAQQ